MSIFALALALVIAVIFFKVTSLALHLIFGPIFVVLLLVAAYHWVSRLNK